MVQDSLDKIGDSHSMKTASRATGGYTVVVVLASILLIYLVSPVIYFFFFYSWPQTRDVLSDPVAQGALVTSILSATVSTGITALLGIPLGYVLARRPERFYWAAARMYAVFDVGAVFYWVIPTAPPWWAATHGRRAEAAPHPDSIRRMMIEYGQTFWGDRWNALYDLLGGNPLAAMPSLHFATSLMAAHLLWEVNAAGGIAGCLYAAMLGLALVYLGEHYLIDLIAGAALTEAIRAGAPGAGRRLAPVAAGLRAIAHRATG